MSAEIECTPSTRKSHGSDVAAEQLGERQHEAAHARVDVAVGARPTPRARRSPGSGRRRPAGTAVPIRRRAPCRSLTAAAIASTSAVQSSRTGVVRIGMSNMWADLWNAAWAVSATTISPARMPRSARPRSRAASTAHWIDSVPPLVRNPAAVSGPCSRPAVHRTTSDWMLPSDGNALVFSAFSWRYSIAARSATSWTPGPPS